MYDHYNLDNNANIALLDLVIEYNIDLFRTLSNIDNGAFSTATFLFQQVTIFRKTTFYILDNEIHIYILNYMSHQRNILIIFDFSTPSIALGNFLYQFIHAFLALF